MLIRTAKHNEVLAEKNAEIKELNAEIARTGVELTKAARHCQWADNQTIAAYKERDEARALLADIAAMETPGANATVKRMAAKAREGLPAEREAV